jgi:hypothetical protein
MEAMMRRLVLWVFGLLALAAPLAAQDRKISDLTSGSPAQAADMIPIARSGANYRLAGSDFCLIVAGTAAPGATECDAANEVGRLYHQTGDPASVNLQLWRCTQTGAASYAWHPASHQVGTAAPATCTVGAVFFDSDATAGLNWFGCTAANTWTVLGTTVTAGSGITTSGTGPVTVSADRAVVPFKGSGTADPPATCGDTGDDYLLHDTYLETDTSEISICIAVDTWALIGHVADDKVIVGTGTAAIVETLPACTDTGGNHLNYDAGGTPGSRFSCGTSGAASADFDPTTFIFYEEFMGGPTNLASANMGSQNMSYSAVGGGGSASALIASAAATPGLYRIQTDTTDNVGQVLYANEGPTGWNAAEAFLDFRVAMGSVGDISSQVMWVGLLNAASGILSMSSGVYFRCDTDLSDTAFIAVICDSSTDGCQSAGDNTNQETHPSTITPSDGGTYRFRIHIDPDGGPGSTLKVFMRVNTETEVTFCSSGCDSTVAQFPTGAMHIGIGVVNRSDSAANTANDVDYVYLRITGLAR